MSNIKVKKYEELSDLEKLSLVDFSYSRIDTYNQCAAKYFYSYIKKEPRQFNAPAALGNIIHDVLENTLSNEKQLNLSELKNEYNSNILKWDPEQIISKELIDVGSAIIDEFYDENFDKQFNIFDKEMPFQLIIGTYKIIGFIDRVDIIDNRVNIIDYKTGKWEVSAKSISDNLQLGIYALALSELFPEKEIYAELYYLRSGKRKGHLFSKEDLENIKINLIVNIKKIIDDNNFTPTSNVRICSFCDHAKTEACGVGVFRNKKRG